VVIPARQAVPVPADLSDEQAASFFVNPGSALIMTRYVLKVPRGAWLLQTAAGSALGRMVIRLGKRFGFRTLNVVRRKQQAVELLQAGGTAVIATDADSLTKHVAEITGGDGVRFAIDAVGGATGSEVLTTLARGGRMLVYGRLAGQPLAIDPLTLLVGQKRVEGFWLSEWVRDQNPVSMLLLFRKLAGLIKSGDLSTEPGPVFPLEQVREAVRETEKTARRGKVLLRISNP
jgi:NADPH:quinone reductase-like Zn-dependent oxidoreductase